MTQPVAAHPKRFRWLKRLCLFSLVLLVALVALRLYWGHRVNARLDQVVADIQSVGDPILFEDLADAPLEESENGATYLMRALNQWPTLSATSYQQIHDTDWYLEGPEQGHADPITDNAAYLARCQPVLDLIRQAAELEDADWGAPRSRPLLLNFNQQLTSSRRLARLMDDAGERAFRTGDLETAFDLSLLYLPIARHIQARPIGVIEILISTSILEINRDRIETQLPHIDPADLRQGPARDKAQQLIAQFTNDFTHRALIHGLVHERLSNFDLFRSLKDNSFTSTQSHSWLYNDYEPLGIVLRTPVLKQAYQPALTNEQAASATYYTDTIAALRADKSFHALQAIGEEAEEAFTSRPLLYPLTAETWPAINGCIKAQYRIRSTRYLTATALAIKLYQADHDGKRPQSLEQLVPDYLSAVPIDPFSPTGETIRYNPAGVVPVIDDPYNMLTDEQRAKLTQLALRPYPLLYSVGSDGVDNGGGPIHMDPQGDIPNHRFHSNADQYDIWFLLDPWPEPIFTDEELDRSDLQEFGPYFE